MNSDSFDGSPAFHEFQIKLAQEFARFYAEIDRKNLTIKALTEERDEVVRMANKLTAERDEARREACESCSETIGGAMLEAEERGWDCFKENTND
jgi:hypothetical protein